MATGAFWDVTTNPKKPRGIKDPAATIDIPFDWAEWLADVSDTYASHTIAVTGGLTVAGSAHSAGVITAFVAGGTLDTVAEVTCQITTTSTPPRVDERTVYLKIEQR